MEWNGHEKKQQGQAETWLNHMCQSGVAHGTLYWIRGLVVSK